MEVADCKISNTLFIKQNCIIYFDEVYDLKKGKYIPDIALVIKGGILDLFIYRVNTNNESLYIKEKSSKKNIEFFELIQEIKINSDGLLLAGYSKNSGAWLEYLFRDYESAYFYNSKNFNI